MSESWIALIGVGFAASLMPLTIGVEIYALGTEKGVRKVISLIGGVILFRILLTIGVMFVSAGLIATHGSAMADIGQAIRTALYELNASLTPKERLVGNLLFILVGVLILVQIVRMTRNKPAPEVDPLSAPPDTRAVGVGVIGMLWIGFILTITNVNQWVLIPVGVNQILRMEGNSIAHLVAYIFFLFLSTAVILLPFLIFIIRPKRAQQDLETLNRWVNSSMRYLMTGIFLLVALYFLWKGSVGVMNYFAL